MARVKAVSSFAHGAQTYQRGQEFEVPEQLAVELERAKLVTRASPPPENKMQPATANKSTATESTSEAARAATRK